MVKKDKSYKAVSVRFPYATWKVLKTIAVEKEVTLSCLFLKCVEKYIKKEEKGVDSN